MLCFYQITHVEVILLSCYDIIFFRSCHTTRWSVYIWIDFRAHVAPSVTLFPLAKPYSSKYTYADWKVTWACMPNTIVPFFFILKWSMLKINLMQHLFIFSIVGPFEVLTLALPPSRPSSWAVKHFPTLHSKFPAVTKLKHSHEISGCNVHIL